MSSAEITLGAHLYTQAIEEDIPGLITQNPQEYSGLQLAFRDMARWLVKNGCVTKDADGNWISDPAGIDKIGEDEAKAFTPYYQTVVLAHQNANSKLTRDGKADYLKDFREIHSDTIFEIEPEKVTRVRAEDLQQIVSSSLNLLQATHDDPANAAFVPGLEKAPMDAMWNILSESGYLMPGENPDRSAPLGDQHLRGTPEQQDALYHQVTQLVANMDLPDTINQGDKPMGAAMNFKNVVQAAHVEEVEVGAGAMITGWDSDLMKADCDSIYNVTAAFARLAHSAQWDTQSLSTLLAEPQRVDDLKVALTDYDEKGIKHCLMSGNMGDPKITPDQAVRFGEAIEWMREAVYTDLKSEQFTGDDGGIMTQGGKAKASARDFQDELGDASVSEGFDNAFDNFENLAATDTGKGTAADPVAFDADADLAADVYGHSDKKVRIPEGLVFSADNILLEMLDNGTVEYLRQRAGRAETDLGDVESSKAAFGSLDEAMGQYRQNFGDPKSSGRFVDVITATQKANMNPERRARLRTAKVVEGRAPFIDYVAGAPEIAGKRMTNWLDEHMLTKKGAPNYDLRRFLRDAAQMPVETKYRSEGEALRAYAEKFVERDREEVEKRKEAGRQNRGLSRVEFDAKDIGRFVDVKEASGTDGQVKMVINADGSVSLSDPDAPKLTSRLSEMSPKLSASLSKGTRSGRQFGGMLPVENLKAAYQTGAEKISILIDGETPYGAIGKMDEEPVRKKTKVQDIVLS
jgi:hypothetical protein